MNKSVVTLVTMAALAACAHHDDPASDPSSASTPNPNPSSMMDGGADTARTSRAAPPRDPMRTKALAPAPVAPKPPVVTTEVDAGATPAPVASVAPTTKPNDTGINERDRSPQAVTPLSQGNSPGEINITAAIRRSVMFDMSLGFTAKNVKIITVGTKVTLRGPVNSDRERSTIETIAKHTPGVTAVDDQIEINK